MYWDKENKERTPFIEVHRATNKINYYGRFYVNNDQFLTDESPSFPDGRWTQMTLAKEQRQYSLYYDNVLASSSDSKGIVTRSWYDVYFGGDPQTSGATGAQYDNI